MKPPIPSQKSYRHIPPLECGGVIARTGFAFQDHVAASYCIEMLSNTELVEVWCENLDDITLIHLRNGQEEFEFVQVKSNKFDHFWSVAELCKQEKKPKSPSAIGSSILEKSLAYERGTEPCSFRMVTCLPINDELKILEYPLNSPLRQHPSEKLTSLCEQIISKLPTCCSPNGNNAAFWVSKAVWEVRQSIKAIEDGNVLKLIKYCENTGPYLASDQCHELYKKILCHVQHAAQAEWAINPDLKRVTRSNFLILLKELLAEATNSKKTSKGVLLNEKMKNAHLPPSTIEVAQEQRRVYRQLTLNPAYMDLSKRREAEMETQAHLNHLLSKLDAGSLADSGVEFHSRCLDKLSELQQGFNGEIPLHLLQGYMYQLADRCLHRFTRMKL